MRLSKRLLVLDIRSSAIEYALYSMLPSPLYPFTGNPFHLTLPLREVKRGSITHEEFPSFIENIKKEKRIDQLLLGLPFHRFTHHLIELPIKKEKEIKTALPFELEKRLPLPLDEYLYDFSILKREKRDTTLILSLAVRISQVFNIIESLKVIPIYGITCTFMAVVSQLAEDNRGRTIIADEDGDFIYLASLLDRELKALRLIRKGEEIEYPSGFEDPSVARYIIKSPSELRSEVTLEESSTYLKDYRRLDLNRVSAIIKYLSKGGKITGGKALNFVPTLPSPLREDISSSLKDPRGLTASLLIGASVFLFLLTDVVAYYKDRRTLYTLSSKLEQMKDGKIKEGPEEEERRLINHYRDLHSKVYEALLYIRRALPEDTTITTINIDIQAKTLEIEGNAPKSSKVLERLESSGYFKKVSYSGAITVKDTKETFKFTMEIP